MVSALEGFHCIPYCLEYDMMYLCSLSPSQKRLHIWDDYITKQEGEENLDEVH